MLDVRLSPPALAMEAYLERYSDWVEKTIGCPAGEAVIFEFYLPFYHLVIEDLLAGAALDSHSTLYAARLRPVVDRWALPSQAAARLQLRRSRRREAPIAAHNFAWEAGWRETPVAVWLKGLTNGVVSVTVPFVSFAHGLGHDWRPWLVVNR